MMFRNAHKQTQTIRFRRWSRKAYAAFASLHKQVTIGCLAVHISDRIGKKNAAFSLSGMISCANASNGLAAEEEDCTEQLLPVREAFLAELCLPVIAARVPAALHVWIKPYSACSLRRASPFFYML